MALSLAVLTFSAVAALSASASDPKEDYSRIYGFNADKHVTHDNIVKKMLQLENECQRDGANQETIRKNIFALLHAYADECGFYFNFDINDVEETVAKLLGENPGIEHARTINHDLIVFGLGYMGL